MANERIIQINGSVPITRLRTNDVMELDNPSLSTSTASAQIQVANVVGGQLMDYEVTTLLSSMLATGSTSIYVIPFPNRPLPAIPSYVSASIMCSNTSQAVLYGNVIYDSTTVNGFQIALSAPLPDNIHKLVWVAYA